MHNTNITRCTRPLPKASQTLPTVIALFFKLEIISRLDGETVIKLRLGKKNTSRQKHIVGFLFDI